MDAETGSLSDKKRYGGFCHGNVNKRRIVCDPHLELHMYTLSMLPVETEDLSPDFQSSFIHNQDVLINMKPPQHLVRKCAFRDRPSFHDLSMLNCFGETISRNPASLLSRSVSNPDFLKSPRCVNPPDEGFHEYEELANCVHSTFLEDFDENLSTVRRRLEFNDIHIDNQEFTNCPSMVHPQFNIDGLPLRDNSCRYGDQVAKNSEYCLKGQCHSNYASMRVMCIDPRNLYRDGVDHFRVESCH